MQTDERGLEVGQRPDSAIGGLLYDAGRRWNAVATHAALEGHEMPAHAAARGYDRAEHPWLHNRRPHDLARRLREWWEQRWSA